ncbi:MAG: TolC family protein [Proteobacteria bacterium]|nr:TolC family protein [Pseudomonadota bacterium]MBU1716791.1 TolC family protein [Pseudomonadota bacterium]
MVSKFFWSGAFIVLLFPQLVLAGEQNPATPVIPEAWTAEQAVNFALHNSPDSKIAWQRIEAAKAAISLQKAALYPTLSFISEYSQTDNAMYSFGNILNQGAFDQSIDFNNPGRTDNLYGGLLLSYRLYNGGRDQAGLKAARAEVAAVEMELRVVHDRLAFEVLRSFNLIIQAEEMVKTHETMVAAINASLVVAQARFEEGVVLRPDLLDLEVQLAGARENLIQSRHAQDLAKQIFLNLLGLTDQQLMIIPLIDRDLQVPLNSSYKARPELKNLEAMTEVAREKLRQANGGYLPVVDGYAGYGVNQGFVTGASEDSWQAGVKLQYNLFEGQRTEAEVVRATAMLAQINQQRRKVELAIELEIKQAELALHEAEERLAVTEKTVDQAAESARINRDRFSEGLILSSDLIAVENRMTNAQIRRAIALTNRRIAVAELRRALGLPQFDGLAGASAHSTK